MGRVMPRRAVPASELANLPLSRTFFSTEIRITVRGFGCVMHLTGFHGTIRAFGGKKYMRAGVSFGTSRHFHAPCRARDYTSPGPSIPVIYPTALCHRPISLVAPRFSNILPIRTLDISVGFTTARRMAGLGKNIIDSRGALTHE